MKRLVTSLAVLLAVAGCTCPPGSKNADRAATTTKPSIADNSGGIRVESARYGRDDVWEDVTPQVRALINGDTIEFPRDLHKTFNVDPLPGRMKYVEMVLVVDGQVMEMTLGDSLHVTPLRLRAAGSGRD